ncbi:DUF2187 family protein [Oceanobacillus senegalensis]|uniref:DUF2187 family protein n=1 Tax=Oceanobacillus senegalensis TaxID=1936063 RepID=UPI000A3107EF|nr:DUF2187 family protein [Oceanobacillus senegalensis]
MENVKKSKLDLFEVDKNKAEPGDIVQFQRNNVVLKGMVMPSNGENSIIVDLSDMDIKDLEEINHGYSNTVVSHRNYKIIERKDG